MPGLHSGGTVVEVLLVAPVDDVLLDVLVVVVTVGDVVLVAPVDDVLLDVLVVVITVGDVVLVELFDDKVQSQRQQPAMSLRFAVQPSPGQSPPGQSASAQQGAPPLLPPMQVAVPRSHASPATHAAPAEQSAAVVQARSGSPAQCGKSRVASPQRGSVQSGRQWFPASRLPAPSSHSSPGSTKPLPHGGHGERVESVTSVYAGWRTASGAMLSSTR